jgi:asparagine synthase (glutamine-hydrolysing)
MSGIFGCWRLDGSLLKSDALRRPLASAPIHPQVTEALTWHRGSVGLSCHSSDHSSLGITGRNRSIVAVFDGRLDNRDELSLALRRRNFLHSRSTDADFVAAAYEEYGDSFTERIKGDWACAIFDAAANRLIVARDPLGVRPLCFTTVNDTFLFASDAKTLLAWPGVSAAPDDAMMADFVLQFVALDSQNRTFFRDIRSLPPAHVLTVTPRGCTIRRYFEFDTERRTRFRTFPEYVDAFHQFAVASVRNRLRHTKPVAVSVSGGLDSSYIFSIASRLMRDGTAPCPSVLALNYQGAPKSSSDEELFVRALEQGGGTTIERIPQRTGFMEFAADEVRHAESPLTEALASQRQALYRRARERGAGRLLTGHWGDQMLFESSYLVDLCRSGRWRTANSHATAWGVARRRLVARCVRDLTAQYFPASWLRVARQVRRRGEAAWRAEWYTERFRKLLRDRFEADRLPRPRGTSHAWAIYQQARRAYHVQCLEWNCRIAAMNGLDVAFPYLDCDLVHFLMTIPGDIQSHDGVPRGLMRAAMRGVVPDSIIDRRSKGEFTQLANESIELDFGQISELLGSSSRAVEYGYVDGPVLSRLLSEWRHSIRSSHNAIAANRVLQLCGMELWLRQFAAPAAHVDRHQRELSLLNA